MSSSHSLVCTSSREASFYFSTHKCKPVCMCAHPDRLLQHSLLLPSILTLSHLNHSFSPSICSTVHPLLLAHPLNPSIFTHCRCCAHAGTLWCILPCLSPYFPLFLGSVPSQPLSIDASEVPQLVESTVADAAKMTAGTPASLPSFLAPSSILPSRYALFATPLSLHSVGAVAPVVHCSGDGHYHSRHSISCQVEVLSPGVFALKHLYQHDVELHPFQEHPGEGCQEEEMEQGRKDCTGNLVRERKDGEDLKIQ